MIAEVTNHLWQSTVFAAVVGLLTLAFRKNRAQVRYWLWLSASVKFLIPFSLLMSLGHDLLGRLAAGKIAAPALSGTIVQITQPFPDTMTLAPAAQYATHWIPIVILGVWACGFAAVALMRFRAWLRVRAALRASTPIDIPAPVPVRSCPGLLEPGVVGFFRPIVLLPEGILKTLKRPQMEAVIAHELSHARRRDNLTAAIHMIVEAVFWFYPVVWWIGARLVEERERACDESVLILGSEPREYADAILNVCKHYVKSPLACVSGIIGSDLKRRIVHIMARHIGQGLTRGRKLLLGGAAAVVIGIPLALGMTGALKGGTQGAEASNGQLPSFKTVSIKLNNAPRAVEIYTLYKDRFVSTESAMNMILFAYGEKHPLKPAQVLGGPGWIKTKVFNVDAKLPKSLSDQVKPPLHAVGSLRLYPADVRRTDAVKQIFRSLLINRFKMRIKHETKELPVYELVLARNGPKIAEDKTADRSCRITDLGPGRGLWLDVKSCDFRTFAGLLSAIPELRSRVLVDKTGLHGRYSFKLHWTPNTPMPAKGGQSNHSAAPSEPSGPSLFTALREQLGLTVQSTTVPVDTIVIEHIEQPTEN
jgi:bla regulator protein blaR1